MIKVSAILLLKMLAVMLLLLASCERNQRENNTIPFNDSWLFIRQDSANADKILPGIIPNHRWEEVSLPRW